MTPELQDLFTRAHRDRDEYEKKFPDEKSPWNDRHFFSSLPEGPTRFSGGIS